MKVIRHFLRAPKKMKNTVVAIGVFDGVHVAHRRLISRAVNHAKSIGATPVVLTFDPHPQSIANKSLQIKKICPLSENLKFIAETGIKAALIIRPSKLFLRTDGRTFIQKVLAGKLGARSIFVGSNFRFGMMQHCGIGALKSAAGEFNIEVYPVPLIKRGGNVISSTLIRQHILKGNIFKARDFLGRDISFKGRVIKGFNQGRVLGYPTANIKLENDYLVPADGVYAAWVHLPQGWRRGMLNIGPRPRFKHIKGNGRITGYEKSPSIELHIIDYKGNLYGKTLTVALNRRLRNNKRFESSTELIRQLGRDKTTTLKLLKKHPGGVLQRG